MAARLSIQHYESAHEPAVHAFNQRILAGGASLLLPERAPPISADDAPLRSIRTFVALEDGEVRGGYGLRRDLFEIDGAPCPIDFYVSPIAESINSPRLAAAGAMLLLDAMRKGDGLYVVGGGGLDTQSVKLYRAAGWTVRLIPFFFRIFNAASFLRNIAYLRRKPSLRLMADIAAATGLGSLAFPTIHALQSLSHHERTTRLTCSVVQRFDDWADRLWEQHRAEYSFTQSHASGYLNQIYPHTDDRVVRLRMDDGSGRAAGWALVVTGGQPFENFFGDMKVGLILDCFCASRDAASVTAAATRYLKAAGMDLAISNQWHPAWQRALLNSGYLPGPSNFPLAFSPSLVRKLKSLDAALESAHLNRGHGDGVMIGARRELPPGVQPNLKIVGMSGR